MRMAVKLGYKIARPKFLPIVLSQHVSIIRSIKHYTSNHNQDRRILLFDNTDCIEVPYGMKRTSNLSSFKIKMLKGGFRRRPELIARRCGIPEMNGADFDCNIEGSIHADRIQHELLAMALKLDHQLFPSEGNQSTHHKLVLDVGCGDGNSMKPLLQMGHSCIGVDLDLRSLSEFTKYQAISTFTSAMTRTTRQLISPTYKDTNHDTGFTDKYTCSNEEKNNEVFLCCQPAHFQQSKFKKLDVSAFDTNFIPFVDVVRWNLKHGLPFRKNSFDMAISISFLQWLFYGARHVQLGKFFSSLKCVLKPRGRAVIQFYPRSASQLFDSVSHASTHFQGALVGDYPHLDRGRKLYLVLLNSISSDRGN